MIHPWARLAGLLIAATAGAVSAAPNPDSDFWSLTAPLPEAPRTEGRLVKTGDSEGAQAALVIWMEEHHAVSTDNGRSPEREPHTGWMVPSESVHELDDMLRQYGKVSRRSTLSHSGFEGRRPMKDDRAPGVQAMINPEAVVRHRDGLQRELDALGDRALKMPNIILLASSFAQTLDNIAAARERYDALVFFDIEIGNSAPTPETLVPGVHGLISLNTPSKAQHLLPDYYGMDPGSVRIPKFGNETTDYLSWTPIAPTLDDMITWKAQVIADDPKKTFSTLDDALIKLGAQKPELKTLPTSRGIRNVVIDQILYDAQPLAGYLFPRKSLEPVRALLDANGRIAAWAERESVAKENYLASERWARTLSAELSQQRDRLAEFPEINSLVRNQLKRLEVFTRLFGGGSSEVLIGLEVLRKPAAIIKSAPTLTSPLGPGDPNYLPPPSPVPHPGAPTP